MADATVAMNVNAFPKGVDNTQHRYIVYGQATITANGGTGPATGLPLNWETMGDGNFNNVKNFTLQVGPTQTKPQIASFVSNSNVAQQYTYDATHNSLIVWGAGAPLTAGIVADTVNFKAEFIRGTY